MSRWLEVGDIYFVEVREASAEGKQYPILAEELLSTGTAQSHTRRANLKGNAALRDPQVYDHLAPYCHPNEDYLRRPNT